MCNIANDMVMKLNSQNKLFTSFQLNSAVKAIQINTFVQQ